MDGVQDDVQEDALDDGQYDVKGNTKSQGADDVSDIEKES